MRMRSLHLRLVAVLLAVAMVAAACGSDGGGADTAEPAGSSVPDDNMGDEPDPEPASDDPVTVESDDGRARLTFVPSALPDGVAADSVSVTATTAVSGAEVDGKDVPALAAYRLEPSGIEFAAPAVMEVDLPLDALPAAPVVLLSSDDGAHDLARTTGAVEWGDEDVTVEVEVDHFSIITVLHGPSPLGARFVSPLPNAEFAVGSDVEIVLEASFERDAVSHTIVTPEGPLRLRVAAGSLELTAGREVEARGAIALRGPATGQLRIELEDDQPSSSAQEPLDFTCEEEGDGRALGEVGLTDVEFELVDEVGAVIGTERHNLLAVHTLPIRCVQGPLIEVGTGMWDVAGGIDDTCGAYPVFLTVETREDGSATVSQRTSRDGPVFQSAAGVFGPSLVLLTLLTAQIFEIWVVLFTGGVPTGVWNSYGAPASFSNAFEPTPAQVAELEAAAARVESEGADVLVEAIDELAGADETVCTAALDGVTATEAG